MVFLYVVHSCIYPRYTLCYIPHGMSFLWGKYILRWFPPHIKHLNGFLSSYIFYSPIGWCTWHFSVCLNFGWGRCVLACSYQTLLMCPLTCYTSHPCIILHIRYWPYDCIRVLKVYHFNDLSRVSCDLETYLSIIWLVIFGGICVDRHDLNLVFLIFTILGFGRNPHFSNLGSWLVPHPSMCNRVCGSFEALCHHEYLQCLIQGLGQ